MSTRAALALLAIASLLLTRRSPSWRPLSASLLLLAGIDVARLVTAPHAALREWGWWQADVCLCALWPVAIGVGLAHWNQRGTSRSLRPASDATNSASLPTARRTTGKPTADRAPIGACADSCHAVNTGVPATGEVPVVILSHKARLKHEHAPIISRLASLCSLAILLGALRPYLPRIVYLTGLRLPRWALAGLWVEALLGASRLLSSPKRLHPHYPHCEAARSARAAVGIEDAPPSDLSVGVHLANIEPIVPNPVPERRSHVSSLSHAPLACSLILAACNTADLVAGAWACAPWEPPSWGYARAVTWAAYAGVGVVMGWGVVRRSRS